MFICFTKLVWLLEGSVGLIKKTQLNLSLLIGYYGVTTASYIRDKLEISPITVLLLINYHVVKSVFGAQFIIVSSVA